MLSMNYTDDVRQAFIEKYKKKDFRNGTVELQSLQFRVDAPTIFGGVNHDYIKAEIDWYEQEDRSVDKLAEIYGKRVKIWDMCADNFNNINSNYGWCIYTEENGHQFWNAMNELWDNPDSRRATMIYNRPTMHEDAFRDGMNDFMCTYAVQYFINDGYVEAAVYMRSNDAVFGFNNDVAWQRHVLHRMARELSHAHNHIKPGSITWHAGSMHVYERHYHLIERLINV